VLVELALALPVLLLLLLGIIKGGIAFNNWITLTEAVRIGGRTLAISRLVGNQTPNACDLATTALKSAATNLNQTNITVPTPTFSGNSTCTSLNVGDSGTMTATYPCDLAIFGVNFAPGCTLSAQITERIE